MKNKFCASTTGMIFPPLFMALLLTACGMQPAKGAGNSTSESVARVSIPEELPQEEQEQLIRTTLEETLASGEVIRKFCFEDYDRNGRPEAFVLTGKELEEALKLQEAWYADEEELDDDEFDLVMEQEDYDSQLALWFAYVQDGEVVSEKIRENVTRRSDILRLKSASLFQCVDYCATSFPADLYQVEGNQCNVIFRGDTMDIHTNAQEKNAASGSDDFQSVASNYDAWYDADAEIMTGHTWKPYYFHYENGSVTEYKGQEMALSEFLQEYSNAEKMLEKYQEKNEVLSVIKRENGIVHINFVQTKANSNGEGYHYNVSFEVSDGQLENPEPLDGIYHTSIEEEGEAVQVQYE